MPEFILDYGTREAAAQFKKLDSFTQGYVEAMFFTECHSDNPELDGASVAELSIQAWTKIVEDCADFQKAFGDDLQEAYDQDKAGYDANRAGNDFWHTRNRHGTGYWDRGLRSAGARLNAMAATYGECSLYRGDDTLLYLD